MVRGDVVLSIVSEPSMVFHVRERHKQTITYDPGGRVYTLSASDTGSCLQLLVGFLYENSQGFIKW